MSWWIWIVAGLVMMVIEMAAPGVFIMFFGAAALVIGLVTGIVPSTPLWLQLLAFSVLSVASLLLFRRQIMRRMQSKPAKNVDDFVDELGIANDQIAPGDRGAIELRGTVWTAVNVGDSALTPGQRCKVVKVDGLSLHVVVDDSQQMNGIN